MGHIAVGNRATISSLFLTNGNFTTTSASLVDVTDLVFPLQANSRYSVVGVIHAGCNNTGGYKLGSTIPAGATSYFQMQGSTTNATTYLNNSETSTGSGGATWVTENNVNRGITFGGTITTGGTAGNFQMKLLSVVAAQTSTIYQEGTILTIIKIA